MNSSPKSTLDIKWQSLLTSLQQDFAELENLTDIAFLIGVQELGQGFRSFSKDEKIDLMHVGICRVLCEKGHYAYHGKDEDGWPHYELIKALPAMTEKEKELYLMEAVLLYFNNESAGDHSG